MDLELNAAMGAALISGRYIARNYGKKLDIEFKSSPHDLVSNIDKEAQDIIVSFLKTSFPEIGFYGEENLRENVGIKRWIIDPLDGTTNFVHGIPFFSVSLALEIEEKLVIGVIYDPLRDELFYAKQGKGAFLNGKRIKVSETCFLKESLLTTGFPYDINSRQNNNLSNFARLMLLTQEVRPLGSAALELAYVACGRFDGFWEIGLSSWDTAAGVVILKEAGGKITGKEGNPFSLYSDFIVASNEKIHQDIIQVLNHEP